MPFTATNSESTELRKGCGQLEVEMVAGQSAATSVWTRSPFKILMPQSRGPSVWACTSSFGGGLVAGDQTELGVRIGESARCYVGTQASTKVYRNPGLLPCSHTTLATLEANSLLVFAPDPVQAFAGSAYRQRQEFHLAKSASLVLLDWFTSGRAARGERWAFSGFHSRNDVYLGGKRVFVDSVLLDDSSGPINSPHRVGRFNCFATLLFVGELVQPIFEESLKVIAARPVQRGGQLLSSESPVRNGAVLRFAGEVEAVARELKTHLSRLAPLLGDNPWARKW